MATSRTIKERGILFSAPMVLAIRAGIKLQTRRAVKPGANQRDWLMTEFIQYLTLPRIAIIDDEAHACFDHPKGGPGTCIKCPYGQVGDTLWVRETYGYNHAAVEAKDVLVYRADYNSDQLVTWPRREKKRSYQLAGVKHEYTEEANHWYPSIFMPRTASRILLEITGVRVERLQDISEADAEAEGIGYDKVGDRKEYHNYLDEDRFEPFAADSFKSLWQSINGLNSWAVNPWCWVIEFKVIEL